jgi:ABC-type glycerol-3-phosphate transport system substrate-binding protein
MMLAKSQLERPGRTGAPKILLVDLDWEAPGLSYMFRSGTLPPGYEVHNEEIHAEQGGWSSIQLINSLYETILGDEELQKAVAENKGIPATEQDQLELMTVLKTKIFGTTDVDLKTVALRILTPPVKTVYDSARANIYLLPAAPIVSISSAFDAMQFDANIVTGRTKAKHPILGDDVLRLFALLLINLFETDFLLIDCRAGVTPLGFMVSTRLTDVVVIPTTTYDQALDGSRVFREMLCKPSTEGAVSICPYCPEKVITGISNVQEGLWKDVSGRLQLTEEFKNKVFDKLGISSSARDGASDSWFLLPHLKRLGVSERFVTSGIGESGDTDADSMERERELLYDREIRKLSDWVVDAWGDKARGFFSLSASEEVLSPAPLYKVLGRSARSKPEVIRILVEKGAFGVDPFIKLLETDIATNLKGRFSIKPIGIEHSSLKEAITENKTGGDFRQILKKYVRPEDRDDIDKLDLVTFPHYMLGRLVKNDWVEPLTVLGGEQEWAAPVDLTYLRNNFYLAEELCSYAGTLYAFPFSVIRKLLLIKKGFTERYGERYEKEYKEPLDLKRVGWREIHRALEIAKKETGGGVIVVEDNFDHVGVWYDWLEFVYAYGGADFFREGAETVARGSDYGECGLNNPATIDGTLAYLRLFWNGFVPAAPGNSKGYDWYHTLERFRNTPESWMAIAWSDILTSETKDGLTDEYEYLPFPAASPASNETIIEGWVIGLPNPVLDGRHELVDAFVRWFLSRDVQEEFVKVGGDSSRKIARDKLPPVLELVHSAFLARRETGGDVKPHVAPKITFPEAPDVIDEVRTALKELVGGSGVKRTQAVVAERMEALAKKVATGILKRKSRYVPRRG